MQLGRVVGKVVSNQKSEKLVGLKLLIVERLDERGKPAGGYLVATDVIGAGIGDTVITVTGSSARQIPEMKDKPIDALIAGIVDEIQFEGE